jgi:hypothetical protein
VKNEESREWGALTVSSASFFFAVQNCVKGKEGFMKRKILCLVLLGILVSAAVYAKTYTITITKTSGTRGVLEFYEGGLYINETCYFTNNPLQKGRTYSGFITHMSTKKDSLYPDEARAGIYIPFPGRDIFIHEGKDESWSSGCIVIDRERLVEIWNYIYDDNPRNYDDRSGNTVNIVVR